jgi:cytochrome c peroxidase
MATALTLMASIGAAQLSSPGFSQGGLATAARAADKAPVALPADRSETMKKFDAVTKQALSGDYETAIYHPIHFPPNIGTSNRADCMTCHQEVLTTKPRVESQAGVKGDNVLAWYQTLDSYEGKQESFHWRHLESPLAKQVMKLECNFCHQGSDPREQSPEFTVPKAQQTSNNGQVPFTNRKRVNPSETCLRCHGNFPAENMGVPGPWHEQRADLEPEGTPNGCLTCHAGIRTERHNVTYLNKDGIDKAAENSSDVCYGCHGGRAWYRISYPYPRTPWPDMDKTVPDWAKDRPTKSESRYLISGK